MNWHSLWLWLTHDVLKRHWWYRLSEGESGSQTEDGFTEHYECDICGDEYLTHTQRFFWRGIKEHQLRKEE